MTALNPSVDLSFRRFAESGSTAALEIGDMPVLPDGYSWSFDSDGPIIRSASDDLIIELDASFGRILICDRKSRHWLRSVDADLLAFYLDALRSMPGLDGRYSPVIQHENGHNVLSVANGRVTIHDPCRRDGDDGIAVDRPLLAHYVNALRQLELLVRPGSRNTPEPPPLT